MKFTLQKIIYSDFVVQLNAFSSKIDELVKTDKKEAIELSNSINNLSADIKAFLNNKISPKPEILVDIMASRNAIDYADEFRINHSDNPEIERQWHRAIMLKTCFELTKDYITLTDPLKQLKSTKPKSIQSKKDFLLKKLLNVFNDNFYDIAIIFDLNDVSYRIDEPTEIANDLDQRGYLTKEEKYSNKSTVRLTVKGASYIERKLNSKKKKVEKRNSENSLHKKIDEILIRLTKLGFGQEIIFDEFEEMKQLEMKLSKKTWGQLLKGKLFELTLSKLINKEIANSIYEFLTDDKRKLLE